PVHRDPFLLRPVPELLDRLARLQPLGVERRLDRIHALLDGRRPEYHAILVWHGNLRAEILPPRRRTPSQRFNARRVASETPSMGRCRIMARMSLLGMSRSPRPSTFTFTGVGSRSPFNRVPALICTSS